jgi:hypothetical protein
MTRNQIRITLLSGFALVAALIASRPVAPQDAKQPYPNMAPIDQYLMDRDAEIALARSAAPDAISHDASVIVLTRHACSATTRGVIFPKYVAQIAQQQGRYAVGHRVLRFRA